mmetsp:Transcript_76311/g.205036  ORF Transcript_76311/g.205036 Transcript_76311/m.205036 type:complete len:92 (-) Transcript_76311:185-460(-)
MQGQIIGQIMAQYYPSAQSRSMLIVNVLSECSGVYGAPEVDAARTYCPRVWADCVGQLEKNAASLGASLPAWLTPEIPSPATIAAAARAEL